MVACPHCGHDPEPGVWDAEKRVLFHDGVAIHFTLTEAALFDLLYRNLDKLCVKERLIAKIWGLLDVGADSCLKNLTSKVRQKLPPGFTIHNIPDCRGDGGGYWLSIDD